MIRFMLFFLLTAFCFMLFAIACAGIFGNILLNSYAVAWDAVAFLALMLLGGIASLYQAYKSLK